MKYVEYTISEIKKKMEEDKKTGTKTVLRIFTKAKTSDPRLIIPLEIGEDYIVGRGRHEDVAEIFSISGISSWRFAQYQAQAWKW